MLEFVLKISVSGGLYTSTGPTTCQSRNSTKEQACNPFLSRLNAADGDGSDKVIKYHLHAFRE